MEEQQFQGKTALITGSSKGIGLAIAKQLAAGGADIAVNYFKSRDAADQAVKELSAYGVKAISVRGNVGNEAHVNRIFDTVGDTFGKLDIFISNAAAGILKPAVETTADDWKKTMEVNALPLLLGSQRAVELMGDRGGKIVAITSLGPKRYIPDYTAMASAKASIEAMVRYLAVELAPKHINVNAVSGGIIDTESLSKFPKYQEMVDYALQVTPTKRVGTPEDIAPVAAFLCSDAAKWIYGQIILADGGYTLC